MPGILLFEFLSEVYSLPYIEIPAIHQESADARRTFQLFRPITQRIS